MSWFLKKPILPLLVDMHSHLIPGLDDGAATFEDSLQMIKEYERLGFKKLITTPHIHPKYPNSQEKVVEHFSALQKRIMSYQVQIELEVAAEYYVDDRFIAQVEAGKPLLSFGNKYVLIECSFTVKPFFFESIVNKLKEQGYNPILAHPERYRFLEGDIDWLLELKRAGLLFQVTLGSLVGYYGVDCKKIGFELIRNNLVEFLASDLHRVSQISFLEKGLTIKEAQKLIRSGKLLNDELL